MDVRLHCAGAHLDDLLQKHRGRNDVRDDDHSSLVLVIVLTSSCSGFCGKSEIEMEGIFKEQMERKRGEKN